MAKKDYRQALFHFSKTGIIFKTFKVKGDSHFFSLINLKSTWNVGNCYRFLHKPRKALQYYQIALKESGKSLNMTAYMPELYREMAWCENALGNHKKASEYYEKYAVLQDSVDDLKIEEAIASAESKFNYKIKQQEYAALQIENNLASLQLKQRTKELLVVVSVVILSCLLGYFWWRNNKNKQKLTVKALALYQEQVKTLQQEKELLAVQATLKGQEEKRTRIAKDLHDGIGGMLAGIKFTLSYMRDTLSNKEAEQLYDKALEQLDKTIHETRRVAHNMMPETLLKYSLTEAIGDYCKKMSTAGQFKTTFQSYGVKQRWGQIQEITVYRIIQELITNAARHAQATHCLVQLQQEGAQVIVTVEDNGTGLDIDSEHYNTGIGLKNVRSRVDLLKGIMQIERAIPSGTVFNIEFGL